MKKFAAVLTVVFLSALVTQVATAQVGTLDIKMENEPNNTMEYANNCPDKCIGAISDINDVDWYKVRFGSLSTQTSFAFTLSDIPTGYDYDLYVYNENGQLLGTKTYPNASTEKVIFPITAGKSYYAKVVSISGFSPSKFYMLTADYN